MRVALVHDWINGLRGGERCLQQFLILYPDADIVTFFHVPGTTDPVIDNRVSQVSFLNTIPGARRWYRHFLPLYPAASRRFDFSNYDLVISLSHSAAKNVHVPENVFHICYCFSPMRYIWDQAWSYFGALTIPGWPFLKLMRYWDQRRSEHCDHIVGISRLISARVRRFYGRKARVIYPGVDTSWIAPMRAQKSGVAFLYAGALVPYKRVDLVIEAFNRLGEELWIVGGGPEEQKLRSMARENVHFFGRVSDEELARFYSRCRALVFPGKEDFGMVPIECLAAGRPVIGLDAGGLSESLKGTRYWMSDHVPPVKSSGVFIPRKGNGSVEQLEAAIRYFLAHEKEFHMDNCIANASDFSVNQFLLHWQQFAWDMGFYGGVPIGEKAYAQAEAAAL